MHHLHVLKEWLLSIDEENGHPIPLNGGGVLIVKPVKCGDNLIGVNVTGLRNQPFLPFDVFVAALSLLYLSQGHRARKGNAQAGRLGDNPGLDLDTVEGHVARLVYGTEVGVYAFQRITPISRILEAAGVCGNGGGELWLL